MHTVSPQAVPGRTIRWLMRALSSEHFLPDFDWIFDATPGPRCVVIRLIYVPSFAPRPQDHTGLRCGRP